jgi:hypothetical protein
MFDRHIRKLLVSAVVVMALAAAVPAAAGEAAERPIKENLSGYALGMEFSPTFPEGDTFDGRCSQPSQWVSTSAGSGVISHLGQVGWTTEHCFQLFAGTFGDAELVITAANGDKLFGTYEGVMTSETTFVETMIITGGTGRFVEASGTIEETGWFDPVTGYMEITGVGSIIYDASNRALSD